MEIRAANGRELRKMKRIYLEAFPRAERKPFRMMKKKARQGAMELLSILDGGRMVGLAVTVRYQDVVLLDYFAISSSCRGWGYGSEALELLKKRYEGQRLILEIELTDGYAVNQKDRIRRKKFYLKNGMKETGLCVRVFQVPMEVLTVGGSLTYEEYHAVYEHTIGIFFAKRVRPLE